MKYKLFLAYVVSLSMTLAVASDALSRSTPVGDPLVLADFGGTDPAKGWRTVNDNVMGGRSRGGPSFADGLLTFAGVTNTNGGGFSSIRTNPGDYDLSAQSGLLIRARGDGRTYKAEVRTDVTIGRWSVPFRADFQTVKGEWREFFLPFDSFTPSMFGRELSNPPALDTSKVSSFGFMIYDKSDGAFKLEIDWVKAVDKGPDAAASRKNGTVIDVALKDGRFGKLATALTKGELVGVLSGEGPLTVFAPTDEAFAKLPKGTLEELFKPENQRKLRAVLKYHVIPGERDLAAALDAGTVNTVDGKALSIGFSDARVRVNGASILDADIKCSNGVIHVIDRVLLPPTPRNDILNVAQSTGEFTTLFAALKAAGMDTALASKGPLTILAPTDKAFESLPDGVLEDLLRKENRDQLKAVLAYHVIPSEISAGDALNAKRAETLNGAKVTFGIEGGLLKVNGATIRKADIACDNGVIHVIDAVLLPPAISENKNHEGGVTATERAPVQRIKEAVERGVPVFNRGNPGECAAIYKACLIDLVNDREIDMSLRSTLKKVLQQAGRIKDDVQRAWLYRNGLDQAFQRLAGI